MKIPETTEQQWHSNNNNNIIIKNYGCHRRRRRIILALSQTEKFIPIPGICVSLCVSGTWWKYFVWNACVLDIWTSYVILSQFNLISSNKYRYLCTMPPATQQVRILLSVCVCVWFFCRLAFARIAHRHTYVYYQTALAKVTEESYATRDYSIPKIYAQREK